MRIVELRAKNYTMKRIADELGISSSTVSLKLSAQSAGVW